MEASRRNVPLAGPNRRARADFTGRALGHALLGVPRLNRLQIGQCGFGDPDGRLRHVATSDQAEPWRLRATALGSPRCRQGCGIFLTRWRVDPRASTRQTRTPMPVVQPAGHLAKASVADPQWQRALRTEDPVPQWDDSRHLRAARLYCPPGRLGTQTGGEPHSLAWRVRAQQQIPWTCHAGRAR